MARMTVLAIAGALASQASAESIPPPPPIDIARIVPPRPADFTRRLLAWMPGRVRCAGGDMPAGATIRRPYNLLVYPSATAQPVTLRFGVDNAGRVHSIVRVNPTSSFGDDIAPALASSRFPAGNSLADCSVTYTARITSLADAPVADLVSYSMNAISGPLPREGWQRIEGGANCAQPPRPQPLLRAYPDFSKVAATPGVRDWSLVRFDTDAGGTPVNLALVSGTGNRDLDSAAVAAVGRSRFAGGARSGCLYPYWRSPAKLPSPDAPARPPESAACSRKDNWAVAPVLRYPEPYARRSIEGWAVLRYDLAPWGAVGNVTVLEAQPSEDFGTRAKRMLEAAKAKPSDVGVRGCSVVVRYAMPHPEAQTADVPTGVTY